MDDGLGPGNILPCIGMLQFLYITTEQNRWKSFNKDDTEVTKRTKELLAP